MSKWKGEGGETSRLQVYGCIRNEYFFVGVECAMDLKEDAHSLILASNMSHKLHLTTQYVSFCPE